MSALKSLVPWMRTVIAVPLCVIAFNTTHRVGETLSPRAYDALQLDSQRLILLCYILLAGVVATFVVVAVSRHRAGLHAASLCAIGLAIDVRAVLVDFHDQPLWFRTLVIALLPVQAFAGLRLGRMTWTLGTK